MKRWQHWVPGAALAGALLVSAQVGLSDPGAVEIKVVQVEGSSTPKMIVHQVMDVPAKKVWAIVSDCTTYPQHLLRVKAAKLLKKEGNVHTCEVTIEMPFPLSNLTAVTDATHTVTDQKMVRSWKLVRGDYKFNEGSWEVKVLPDGKSDVTYTVHAEPNTAVPDWIREKAQKKTLPELMERVRTEAAKLP